MAGWGLYIYPVRLTQLNPVGNIPFTHCSDYLFGIRIHRLLVPRIPITYSIHILKYRVFFKTLLASSTNLRLPLTPFKPGGVLLGGGACLLILSW